MRCLLVGNAPDGNLAGLSACYDLVVQVNKIVYLPHLAQTKSRAIFVCNTGEVTKPIVDHLLTLSELHDDPSLVVYCARNHLFYSAKRLVLRALGKIESEYFRLSPIRPLKKHFSIRRVSFVMSLRLEVSLLRRGMAFSQMPSTGHIALRWLINRLSPMDTLHLVGFSFIGWCGHPYQIEQDVARELVERSCRCEVSIL